MKTLRNTETKIAKSETEKARYADLLISILNKPLQKMVSLKEMRRDIKLIDKLEESGDTIELTDDDFKYLSELVTNSEWAIKHIDILEFAEYIESLAD